MDPVQNFLQTNALQPPAFAPTMMRTALFG